MADYSKSSDNAQLLQELDALSHSLHQSRTGRRTASLALPRSSIPAATSSLPDTTGDDASRAQSRPRSRRMSISPWRSSTKAQNELDEDDDTDDHGGRDHPPSKHQSLSGITVGDAGSSEKKGIWSWKPIRALSHIGMQRLGCLFSVEVVAVQGLPASMNGLRLSVTVRKKETKDGAVQTMPARVLQGSADFEETLFIRTHIYCNGGAGTGKPLKLEPRPFLVAVVAIDAPELDFGRSSVNLSILVKESMEKNFEGSRVRQWDTSFTLAGKAKRGELVLKLGYQIMEDGGVGIYNQAEGRATKEKERNSSFSLARKQSKSSFSVTSPKLTRSEPSSAKMKDISPIDLKNIEDFSLDGEPVPAIPPSSSVADEKSEQEPKDDLDLPDFEVVEKGVEIQVENVEQVEEGGEEPEVMEVADESSASVEVVKEVVHDSGAHSTRLTELDAIANQIKALESLMMAEEPKSPTKELQEDEMQRLDAEEDAVTREFLQMLELEEEKQPFSIHEQVTETKLRVEDTKDGDKDVFLSDLGKGLGSVVQTRDGGYLAATNPLDVEVSRKDTPKLAMQISKPFIILGDEKLGSGLELFQRVAAIGTEGLINKLQWLTSMDELMGKTAEQIAFEGMASAIISGRSKEGASSSAARIVAALKTMGTAMSEGRKERILTGIWNIRESPVPFEEILALSLQKIESMAVEALKIKALIAEEEAPFEVQALITKEDTKYPLDFAIPAEEWERASTGSSSVALMVGIQMRDPLRRYEAVGAPTLAIIQAARVEGDEFKLTSMHVGGLKFQSGGRRSIWDGEKQRLTAMQWLVAYGLGKAGKKKPVQAKGGQDLLWSMSSRVMADMWLKPMRNPDVKIPKQE